MSQPTEKIITETIENFYGGVLDDVRTNSPNGFTISKHFDIFTYPKRLVPFRNNVADESDGSTSTGIKQYKLQEFTYYPTDGYVYGLGKPAAGTGYYVAAKSSLTGASWNATLGNTTNSSVAGRQPILESFTFDGTQYHYWVGSANYQYIDELSTPAKSVSTVAHNIALVTTASKGITAKDGNFYIGIGQSLVKLAAGTPTTVLTPLTNYNITSLTNYGNYLAIATVPTGYRSGQSKVFLWDLVSSDVTESIEWGEGQLKVLDNVDGVLIGVSDENMASVLGNDKGKMVIREYRGGVPTIQKEIEALYTGGYVKQSKAVKGGRLRFVARVPISSTEYYEGVWSYGRKSAQYPSALTLEIVEEDANSSGIDGFAQIGNFDFIAHSADGSIQRTNDTDTFTYTSINESRIFGNPNKNHALVSAGVSFKPLPAAGQVVLKYKVNGDTSWTTLFTETTDNEISRKALNLADGTDFSQFKEVLFRIESTGGAEITGLEVRYKELFSK